jgi:hypothetical protein
MKTTLLFSGLLAFGLTSGCNAQPSTAPSVQQTSNEIRTEAIRKNDDPIGHALPLLGSWNPGAYPRALGFSPEYQINLIEQGHHVLPGFAFPSITSTDADIEKSRAYYEAPLQRAAEIKLPITLIGTQWEQVLYQNKKYLDLPPEQNPNVVTPDGKIEKKLSPFGPVEPWREVGAEWSSSPLMKQVQQWYPNPPRVILLSNNEAGKLNWKDVEQDARYLKKYGKGRSDEFKRKVVADGWIERYRALQEGMRDALSKSWQSKVLFVGYNAFGGAAFGRWPGWINYSITTPDRIDPDPLMWDGGTPPYYTATYNNLTDFRVMSPQIEAMNWVFMQKQALQLNPNFWFSFSVWDGYTDVPEKDLRTSYERLGQKYTPTRYGGYAQFGLWLLRPRMLREYSGYTSHGYEITTTATDPWTFALANDIDHIYQNDTLKYFWRKGTLVPNRAHQHPYQTAIPEEYKKEDRWYLLDTNLDPPRPWKLDTEIPVYSIAFVDGAKGNRRWLVYAHSPLQDRNNVEITIPDYGKITVDVPVAGAFYTVDEKSKAIQKVS